MGRFGTTIQPQCPEWYNRHASKRGKEKESGGQDQQLHMQQTCPKESSEEKEGQRSKTAITIICEYSFIDLDHNTPESQPLVVQARKPFQIDLDPDHS